MLGGFCMSHTALPSSESKSALKPENIWINLICNVVLPGVLLGQLSKPERLGPVWGLVVALLFPLGYGLWDLVHRRQFNFLSGLGLVSVLMTGILGLLKTDPFWERSTTVHGRWSTSLASYAEIAWRSECSAKNSKS